MPGGAFTNGEEAAFTNNGTTTVYAGGTFANTGSFTNAGEFTSNGAVDNNGEFTNNGTLTVNVGSGGAFVTNFTENGTFTEDGGTHNHIVTGEATCTKSAVCSICGVFGEPLGHDYEGAPRTYYFEEEVNGYYVEFCNRCGEPHRVDEDAPYTLEGLAEIAVTLRNIKIMFVGDHTIDEAVDLSAPVIVIGDGAVVTVRVELSCQDWTVNDGGQLIIDGVSFKNDAVTVDEGGTFTITGGGTFDINGTFTNNGAVVIDNGKFINRASFANNGTVAINEGGEFENGEGIYGASMENNGSIVIGSGGLLTNYKSVSNGGSITVEDGGTLNNEGGEANLANAGDIIVEDGGTFANTGNLSGNPVQEGTVPPEESRAA
jgi:hypothetical protein